MITINGTDYEVKWGLRTMFIFEQITQKRFSIDSTMDSYLLFYSMILANNKDCTMSFDEFIDALDNDPTLITQLDKAISNKTSIEKILNREEDSKNVENL